jgi:terminase large subunit-like protein
MALARDLARALDAASTMREVGLEPDPWQAALLSELPDRVLINCCRQAGKSTTAALVALHQALFQPHSLVLLVSPSLRQSSEPFRKVADFYHRLAGATDSVQESALKLELSNASRIVSLPGSESTTRGYSAASLVIVDEAARVPDDLIAAVRPTLAIRRGKLIAMSTPWGRRGWWHKAWEHDGDAWRRFMLTADECPRISPEFLKEEREALGDFLFQQEYECKFLDEITSVFSSVLIEQAVRDDIKPLWS